MFNFCTYENTDPKWTEVVSKAKSYDFYHTQCYHSLEETGRSVLFVAGNNDAFVALPLIIRNIKETGLYDCTSVYGYCGPIASTVFEELPDGLLDYFKEMLLEYFTTHGVVSVFSRLHPLINSDIVFDGFGTTKFINKTVAIDLRLTVEEQRQQYRKSNKPEISKLQRNGYEVVEAKTNEEIDKFVDIYYETMKRVEAGKNYFFSKDYFYRFLNNSCFQSKLLLAKKDGEIAGGAIFTFADKIMQYHLAGTTEKYMRDTPMKLVLDQARILGNDLGLDFLHLGGGVGGSDEDSLFLFKSGFSKFRCDFKIWQFIVNTKKYNELSVTASKESTFFPLYRSVDK